ncbi:STAS domain-containing protein [Rubrolithibacter danxiaensis]|uniref:STAS domain-containing protein n=1 Tax=Rubrolithibacter danxiaensis TaxID=3390805 RepID=UPI003BF90623
MILECKEFPTYLLAELNLKEANLVEAERFKNEMLGLINQGHKQIIVSFKNVAYVDSSFLGALVSSLKYAMSNQADISVVYLNKDIFNLFKLIRMDKVFKVHDNLPEA